MKTMTSRARSNIPNRVNFTFCPKETADNLLSAVSRAELRGLLAEEETDQIKKGMTFPHTVTPSNFVRTAIDTEENQYVVFIV
jgi:hypothetical protein